MGAAPPARATALEEVVEFLLNVARLALPLGFERGGESQRKTRCPCLAWNSAGAGA